MNFLEKMLQCTATAIGNCMNIICCTTPLFLRAVMYIINAHNYPTSKDRFEDYLR